MTDEGLCRVGWSTDKASLDLGTDKFGFGFGGTGKKSFGKQFDSYGEVSIGDASCKMREGILEISIWPTNGMFHSCRFVPFFGLTIFRFYV